MKTKTKITILAILCTITLWLITNMNVNASSAETFNEMEYNEQIAKSEEIMNNLLDVQSTLPELAYLFESNTYEKFTRQCNEKIIHGNPISKSIDIVDVSNSGTNDKVIMINYKVTYSDNNNIIYMCEVHINKSGRIYGYNIWAY